MSRGGKREGAGRKKGIPNKSTAEIKELAQQYAPEAIAELARLMKEAESEAARVTAIKEILDRAYGKSPQALTGEGGGPIQHQVGVSWMTEDQAKARGWA
jgi:hypothetical protein